MGPKRIILHLTNATAEEYRNSANDFLTVLPKTIRLEGEWTCMLAEFEYSVKKKELPDEDCFTWNLCCSICTDSLVGRTYQRLLRRIPMPKGFWRSLQDSIRVPVAVREFKEVSVYLTDDGGRPVPLREGVFNCTLVLEKEE